MRKKRLLPLSNAERQKQLTAFHSVFPEQKQAFAKTPVNTFFDVLADMFYTIGQK